MESQWTQAGLGDLAGVNKIMKKSSRALGQLLGRLGET